MENTQQLMPIAVKESVAFRTVALVEEGYVRVEEAIQCPLCGERFLLMLHSRGGSVRAQLDEASRQKTVTFFLKRSSCKTTLATIRTGSSE